MEQALDRLRGLAGRASVEADRAVDLASTQGHAEGHGQHRRRQRHGGGEAAPAAAVEDEVDRRGRAGHVADRPEPAGEHRRDGGERRARPGCGDRLQHWAYQSVARIPNPAQSVCPAEYQHADEAITDVVPTAAIAASPTPMRPVSRATSRPVSSITAARIPYDASARTSGSFSSEPAHSTRAQVRTRQAGTMCVLCGTNRFSIVRPSVREAET